MTYMTNHRIDCRGIAGQFLDALPRPQLLDGQGRWTPAYDEALERVADIIEEILPTDSDNSDDSDDWDFWEALRARDGDMEAVVAEVIAEYADADA